MVGVATLGLALISSSCARKKVTGSVKTPKGLSKVHFDFDKADIKAEFEPVLKANAEWLKKNANAKVTVEGHCDERGTLEYNIGLGDRRAKAAKGYVTNLGVDKGRLNTISYGEEKPMAGCHDESCWQQNRRAEFVSK